MNKSPPMNFQREQKIVNEQKDDNLFFCPAIRQCACKVLADEI
jgi:hypothetical protein